MEFLSHNEIRDEVRRLVASNHKLYAAVAYWGAGAAGFTKIESREDRDNVHVICDLLSGACNPGEIKRLIDLGVCVKTHDYFHAKVWIAADAVIVGSANASTTGLPGGEDDVRANVEAALITQDRAVINRVERWWKVIWNESRVITGAEFRQAEALWKKRQRSARHRTGKSPDEEERRRPDRRLRRRLIQQVIETARKLCRNGLFDRTLTMNAIRLCCAEPNWLQDYERYINGDAYSDRNALKSEINREFGRRIKGTLGCEVESYANGDPVRVLVRDEIVGSFTALASYDPAEL